MTMLDFPRGRHHQAQPPEPGVAQTQWCRCEDDRRPEPCPPGPPWWSWGRGLRKCWDEIAEFKRLIKEVIDELGGPIKTGPIIGVVDGSNAKPGEVGEYFYNQVAVDYSGAQNQMFLINTGIVQPGDWALSVQLWTSSNTTGVAFFLSAPAPEGISNGMGGVMVDMSSVSGLADISNAVVQGQPARLSCTVPTLIPFEVHMNYAGNGPAGTANMALQGWRMR